jgi:phosphotransferase system enzyme I (PtsI)
MGATPEPAKEVCLQGLGAAPGIAQGTVIVHRPDDEETPAFSIEESDVPGEIARFEAALLATRTQILEMQQRIADAIGAQDAGIFDAHLLVVEDRTLIEEVIRLLKLEKKNVESIFQQVAGRYSQTLSEIDDPYLRERALDIHDVTRRVVRNLLGKASRTVATAEHPHILVAHNLTPSDTAVMNRSLVLGFATDVGSKTSHTAIMARSLDIPAVVGLHNASTTLNTGDRVLLDGYNGLLFINPSDQTLWEYGQLEIRKDQVEKELSTIREVPAATKDGRRIILSANIELPEEVEMLKTSGAEGIGLYRTEFFFLNRDTLPDEDEQTENYSRVASAVAPESIIIRTLDMGGDKLSENVPLSSVEANPFLGWRAIRVCLERKDLFKKQLRAILRAAVGGNVRLMYPMVSGIDELRAANEILEECRQELAREGVPFADPMEVGAMIEVPSAALTADILADEVDFFSIGTNDLIQYTIAVDRLNERITHLYQPTHPAIVRLIKSVVDAAHAKGKWVGVCGEAAGEVVLTPLLLGLGIDELSVGAGLVLPVKRAVQSLDSSECAQFAQEVLSLQSADAILQRCNEVARAHYPELF